MFSLPTLGVANGQEERAERRLPWADGWAFFGAAAKPPQSKFPPGNRVPLGADCTVATHVFRMLVSYAHCQLL